MISLSDVTIMRGTKTLLDHASTSIFPGQKVGIIGRNGCGKSTLFAAIKGEVVTESGNICVPRGFKISSVSQQTPSLDIPALDYVKQGDLDLQELLREKERAYAQNNGEKIALIEDKLGIAGAWTIDSRAKILMHGLGFSEDEMGKAVKEFSGGWRMRLNLAQALIYKSDVLLLDEPTNHLDLDTIIFLENYLKSYQGTIMCISHDRDFLDTFCSHILHFEAAKLVTYTGNYSDYERLRAERIRCEKANRKREEASLAHMQDFVERFRYKASKAKQAQSMLKAIDRLKLTAVTAEESPYHIHFQDPERTVDIIADLKELDCGYGDESILKNINLMLIRGDRIGLLGRNGQGKSTLIKTLCSVIPPVKGTVTLGKGIKIGYFAQHELDQLSGQMSALDHLRAIDHDAKEKDLRTFLGSFSFSGDKATAKVETMSGGEQARLALAIVAYQKPNLLLLDEPTNHLVFDMREALSLALSSYQGALILVSHDRHLLEAIADKLWLIDDGKVSEFNGDLNDYQEFLNKKNKEYKDKLDSSENNSQNGQITMSNAAKAQTYKTKEQKKLEAQKRQALRPLKLEIEKLEKHMEKLKKDMAAIDEALADGSLYQTDSAKAQEMSINRAKLNDELDETEMTWLEKQDELEKAQAQ